MDWKMIGQSIGAALGERLPEGRAWPIGGGSINSAFRFEAGERAWFVKLNRAERLPMFEAEAAGLAQLRQPGAPRVPAVISCGRVGDYAYLALEYVPLRAATAPVFARLGEQLAELHRVTGPCFGWTRDNTIGTTPQINTQSADWPGFFRDHRLGYQLELAAVAGHPELREQASPLMEGMERLFSGYPVLPALLHGDLWSGNTASDMSGAPVIFDPACYFGDRESDIATTELFGGFAPSFYDAYRTNYPLDPGYPVRRDLYQLFHVLNHLVLFGRSYRPQAEGLIARLRAQL